MACTRDLILSNSDSSGVTVENFGYQAQGSGKDKFTGWTDEKHNSYLDVLEATFVKQLHHSMTLYGRKSQVQGPSTQQLFRERGSSDQFMVLQDGARQQRNNEIREPLLDSTADSNNVIASPKLYCLASKGKHNSAMFSEQNPQRYWGQIFSGSTAEVSGQNFEDEEKVKKNSSVSRAKRLKTTAVDASGCDQIVSQGYDYSTFIETEASSKRGKRKARPEQREILSTTLQL